MSLSWFESKMFYIPSCWSVCSPAGGIIAKGQGALGTCGLATRSQSLKAFPWKFPPWSWRSPAFWSAKAWTFCDSSFFYRGVFLCHAYPSLRDFSPHRTMWNKKVKFSIQKPWKISHAMKVDFTNGVYALLRDNSKLRGVTGWQKSCLACLRPKM